MKKADSTYDVDTAAASWERIVIVCDRFEAAWRAGSKPRIEDLLAVAAEGDRQELFRALLPLELELARADQTTTRIEDYQARFPSLIEVVNSEFPATGPDIEGLPERIGRYLVVAFLDEGGQAQVFRVVHPELGKELVLKRSRRPVADGDRERALLKEEGRLLAGLDHPNLVRVFDLDVDERGRPFLVMEHVAGRTLMQEAEGRGLPAPRRAARLVSEVARAVEYVHRRGVVHQDIKPQNVLIDETGRPRLIDFGLARLHHAWAEAPSGPRGGTRAFMAPEQARGEPAGPAADVYALGGLLGFLMTGRSPRDIHGASSEAPEDDRSDGAEVPAPGLPASPRGPRRICLKAMAADPRSRYSSADALRRALERYLIMPWAASALGAVAAALFLGALAWPFPAGLAQPTASRPPRVTRFEIVRYPKIGEDQYDPARVGVLGENTFNAREDDEVSVQAELSGPAYSYLIAFRPDGTDALCDPANDDTPPAQSQHSRYPTAAHDDERYRLSEGTGLYAFVLVASRAPLPAYRAWKQSVGAMPWPARTSAERGAVWRDDDHGLRLLLAERSRGKAPARSSAGPTAPLTTWLRHLPGVDAVALEAFPVLPAAGP